jgi:hypothetical protein
MPYFYTDEELQKVLTYLDSRGIYYERRDTARMLIIYHPQKKWKRYDYRWSTGRWSPLPNKLRKHYCSRGIEDFVNRFLKPEELELDDYVHCNE